MTGPEYFFIVPHEILARLSAYQRYMPANHGTQKIMNDPIESGVTNRDSPPTVHVRRIPTICIALLGDSFLGATVHLRIDDYFNARHLLTLRILDTIE